jgi:predicted acetyltransferase
MTASKLIKPSTDYQESFLEALQAYKEEGYCQHLSVREIRDNFSGFVENLASDRANHYRKFDDWVEVVPETVLWLVKDQNYLGNIVIRHRLNWHLEKWGGHIAFIIRPDKRGMGYGRKILLKAIPYANALGIDRALLTVAPDNKTAVHIIKKSGAVFEDETPGTERFPARYRFWLNCS